MRVPRASGEPWVRGPRVPRAPGVAKPRVSAEGPGPGREERRWSMSSRDSLRVSAPLPRRGRRKIKKQSTRLRVRLSQACSISSRLSCDPPCKAEAVSHEASSLMVPRHTDERATRLTSPAAQTLRPQMGTGPPSPASGSLTALPPSRFLAQVLCRLAPGGPPRAPRSCPGCSSRSPTGRGGSHSLF